MELLRALAVLAEPPRAETVRLAGLLDGAAPAPEEYTALFTFQLYPYASVYLGPEGMLGGEARDRIAGLWRALGEAPPPEPDHLAVLLGLYGHLAALEDDASPPRRAAVRRTRQTLLWEHLLSWVPAYLDRLRGLAPPAYAAWERVLRDALIAEARALPPPPELPLHLREAPALPPRAAGREEWLAALLAPVRCGLILTRSDLRRAAAALDLGLRAGERRYALGALLEQDARVCDWLADEADAWQATHAAWEPVTGPLARFWMARAARTAAALRARDPLSLSPVS